MKFQSMGNSIDKINVEISYKIIQLFSAGLYSSPNKAFEELVCNSYDAFADKVSVFVPNDLSTDEAFIWICDNGEGLNPKELKDLWRIGESSKRSDSTRDANRLQIGQFGIGKLATYILAHELTYISKKDDKFIFSTMDYNLINTSNDKLELDEREISEKEAEELISYYTQNYKFTDDEIILFGKNSAKSWTMALLTKLKPKAHEIKEGRLKWILKTALPLNPGFNLHYNGQRIESSKISIPITKEWIIGKDDKTAEAFNETACKQDSSGNYFVDFPNLKGVSGTFTLYQDSLLQGKSGNLGRSHGIFLNVRGRLINLDDPLLGMDAFSHGAFNRTRIVINADSLDDNLTSTREAIKESLPYTQLKDYIKRKFNSEVRVFYFEENDKVEKTKTISYRLSQTSYSTSKRPIYKFVEGFYSGRIINPFLIEKLPLETKSELQELYKNDLETGTQIIESIEEKALSSSEPIAKLDIQSKTLTINTAHPFIGNYWDAYQSTLPLQSVAITEVLTEAYLYELEIDEDHVNKIMRKRDTTLREFALSDKDSIPTAALLIKDAIADPNGLEDAVQRAMTALGYEARKIGGKGEPDGFAEAKLGYDANGASLNYSLTFDAKSTSKDRIAAGTAHLSGLNRHKEKYKASYAIEVAVGYQGQDDPDSAICKESIQQKITMLTAQNVIDLLLFAVPKQLSLGKLRNLFDTCYSPVQVNEWIEQLSSKQIEKPPYNDIIDIIYELQSTDIEAPNIATVRGNLNTKVGINKYKTNEIEEHIRILKLLAPELISVEGNTVNLNSSAGVIKNTISKIINNDIPIESRQEFMSIFSVKN